MRLLAGLVATALLLHEEQIPDTEAEAATNAIVENAGLAPGSSHCPGERLSRLSEAAS